MCRNETNRQSGLCKQCEEEYLEEQKAQREEDLRDYYASQF
jgi:hypothetical protein